MSQKQIKITDTEGKTIVSNTFDIPDSSGGTQIILGSSRPTELDLSSVMDVSKQNMAIMPEYVYTSEYGFGWHADNIVRGLSADPDAVGPEITSPTDYWVPLVVDDTLAIGTKYSGSNGQQVTLGISTSFQGDIAERIQAAVERVVQLSAPSESSSGQLTEEQMEVLNEYSNAQVSLNNEIYYPMERNASQGYYMYSHVGEDANKVITIKIITITINTKGWVLTIQEVGAGGPAFSLSGNTLYIQE